MICRVESSDSTSKTLSTVLGRYFSHRTTSDDLPLLTIVSAIDSSSKQRKNRANKVEKISDFDLNPLEQIVSEQGLKKKENDFRSELLGIAKTIEDFLYVCFAEEDENRNKQIWGKI